MSSTRSSRGPGTGVRRWDGGPGRPHEHLYSPRGEGEELHTTQRKFLPVVVGYGAAILIGLAFPVLAVALYSGIAVYLVVPFREVARVLGRRRGSRP